MATDPRLGNASLLALAAFRLQQRRQHQVPDWRYTEGISSLLASGPVLATQRPMGPVRRGHDDRDGQALGRSPHVAEGGGRWGLIRD
jgi:hypothetical protein